MRKRISDWFEKYVDKESRKKASILMETARVSNEIAVLQAFGYYKENGRIDMIEPSAELADKLIKEFLGKNISAYAIKKYDALKAQRLRRKVIAEERADNLSVQAKKKRILRLRRLYYKYKVPEEKKERERRRKRELWKQAKHRTNEERRKMSEEERVRKNAQNLLCYHLSKDKILSKLRAKRRAARLKKLDNIYD